jgi:hypothetical protein
MSASLFFNSPDHNFYNGEVQKIDKSNFERASMRND